MFSTRLLTQFVAVAEELHFGRAALRVHMAQSPLSQAIRKLEDGLGVELFSRTKRSVALTQAGEVFLQEARTLLRAENSAIALTRHAQAYGSARLAIGFVGNVAYGIIPQLLWAFRRSHPQVHLDISEMLTRDQVRNLIAGQLDVGIVRLPIQNDSGLSRRIIESDRFVVALPAGHPKARQKSVVLTELKDEPFVAYSHERVPVLHSAGVTLCLQEGFYPNVVCQAWQASTILSFVAAGVGIALVPSHLTVFRHAGLHYVPVRTRSRAVSLDIAVIWRAGDESQALHAFLATVPEYKRVRGPERSG